MAKYFLLLPLLATLCVSGCGRDRIDLKKYNVILIAVDTLRADHLGCYGYSRAVTPHLDAFAKKSIFFQNAFCPIPKTSASFASMLTGLHPFIHKTKPNRGFLDKRFLTLAELLQNNGYHTAAIVDNANLSSTFLFNQGFETYTEVWNEVQEKEQSTPFISERAISFLKNPGSKPFFLWLNYIEPHTPYVPPMRFVRPGPRGRDVRQVKNRLMPRRVLREMEKNQNYDEGYYVSLYDGAVSYIDFEVGRIIDTFTRQGLDKNTILIFTADHGEDLGERDYFFDHGVLTFTATARVPLILFVPGRGAAVVEASSSVMDIYPTVLDCLGQSAPYPLQGVSLLKPEKDRLLHIIGIGSHAMVKNNHHYISIDPKTSKKLRLAPNHLYDLAADPRETRNLFSGNAGLALALARKYDEYLKMHGYFTRQPVVTAKKKLSEKERKSLETLGYL